VLKEEYDAFKHMTEALDARYKNMKEAFDTEQLDHNNTKEESQARVTVLERDTAKLEEEIENLKLAH
jgi:polyhydroxyalkanoate synthesis regulator phasin